MLVAFVIVVIICATVLVALYKDDIIASINKGCPTKLTCLNGGVQSQNTCLCVCPDGFGGELCQNKTTPPTLPSGTGGGTGIKTCSGNCVNGSWDPNCICVCDSNWQGSDCNTPKTIVNPNLVTKIIISKPDVRVGTLIFQADGADLSPSRYSITQESFRIIYSFQNPTNITKITHISSDTSHMGNQIDLFNGTGARFGDSFVMTPDRQIDISYKYGLIIDKQFIKQPVTVQTCQSCKNGGLLNSADCTCICPLNYSGTQCQTNTCASCLNGGTLNPATCACTCPANFTGARCETNTCKMCQNYGQLNPSTCACTCFDGYKGALCEIPPSKDCSTVICKNGGTVDPITCACKCPAGWTGIDCGTRNCTGIMKPCARGTVDPTNCTCACPPYYSGMDCSVNTCPLVCQNGGVLDPDNCKCTCPAGYKGLNCSEKDCTGKACVHGTLDANCACQCQAGWKGIDCNTPDCTGKPCVNGVFDANCNCICSSGWLGTACDQPDCSATTCINGTKDATCKCVCNPTWSGATCNVRDCSATKCVNGVKDANCICQCSKGWLGNTCEVRDCSAVACLNGTKDANCMCTCLPGWKGADCSIKDCTGTTCLNGGTPDANCICQCPPDWMGTKCETRNCSNAGCLNGGAPDANCACQCVGGWSGTKCEIPPIYPDPVGTYAIKAPGKSLYVRTTGGTANGNPQALDSCAGFPAACKWGFRQVAGKPDTYSIKPFDNELYLRSSGGNPTWLAGTSWLGDASTQYQIIKGDRPGSIYFRTAMDPTKYLMTRTDWLQGGSLDARVCSPGTNQAGCQWELAKL